MSNNAASSDATTTQARRDIVLVVDDSPETLSFLTEAIEAAGATVLIAVDGESALSLMEQITPDLVLLDAVMPGIGGFETCRRLKRSDQFAHIPIIFMTGLSDTEHIVKGLEAGGVDYLTKPIVLDELVARMRVHLSNARRAQDARAALDATGRFLLAVRSDGRLLWSTPQAAKLLRTVLPLVDTPNFRLPADIVLWITQSGERRPDPLPDQWHFNNAPLQLVYLGQIRNGEHLLRLSSNEKEEETSILRRQFSLTGREAEVLLWVARGKSNKDISNVLHISPRTVNKHLEQIFEKLGVENRASAAALTIATMHSTKK
ncbi:response regulator transcription factor [Dongia deserti]|uniref:response regulator transcription factor n=1 Tax=Dongia deserti TaxID=2268030 RepID=UPI0025480E88|nr:response regulator transcription factor [Dongia deserti]